MRDEPTLPMDAEDPRSGSVNSQPSPVQAEGLARRRLLLKGLGAGSAAVAAATPIKTLAANSSILPDGRLCSISGVQSTVHSRQTITQVCGGMSPGWYKNEANWPNYNVLTHTSTNVVSETVFGNVSINVTFTENTTFKSVFGAGLNVSMINVMNNYTSSDEFHWIPALLNAIKSPTGYVFPYSPGEVIAFYKGLGPYTPAQALQFFKDWMEKV